MNDHKLNTSAGGRGYIADYFKTQLKRHDFTTYINERLAADFACVLAQHLESDAAARRESFAALERENEELKTQLRLAAGDADEKDRLIEQLKYPQMCLEARKADAAEAVKLQRLLMADYRACRPMGEGLMGWAAAALQKQVLVVGIQLTGEDLSKRIERLREVIAEGRQGIVRIEQFTPLLACLAPFLNDVEAIEGCLEWVKGEEQTVNVGETMIEGRDTLLESSAGWITRLLTAMLAAVTSSENQQGEASA